MRSFNSIVVSLLIISAVIMINGYVQLNNSVVWGMDKANTYMREQMGGSMDTNQFNIMLQNFIDQLKWKGSILLSLSGILFITCIFSLLFKNSSRLN
ncbi:hypothetical protein [Paenibacillus sp. UNC496MF]|uniref:hypothetical protein n=1 Tax=Paenibacillus sp. UNC496MF TaxID=1502753 RepID=UPI0011601D2F|nr:hypothetical protein [Paenibacillus sp. UNC496MF]